ncbi:unnamed protein product [Caenorhabditis brenneri]
MRIALSVISFFILATELYAEPQDLDSGSISSDLASTQFLGSLDVHEELSIRRHLEEARDELVSPYYYDPKASPYAAPQTALNDRMFVSVEEYPDGYTGYHCSNIGNFRYTLEMCSKHVWECIDGKLFKKTCPGSSVFWFREEICGEISHDPTSRHYGEHSRGSNWPPKFIQAARVKNDTDHHIMITTDCTKVWTGYYAFKDCFPWYIYCSVGELRMQSCQNLGGMVFDDRIKNCVSMEACKAPLEGKFRGVRMQTLQWDDEPSTRELREMIPEFVPFSITTDCSKKTFSNYGYEIGKCHQNFVVCGDGIPVIQACPYKSVFSVRKQGCIERKECEETWDDWSEKLLSPTNNTVIPVPENEPLSFYRRPEEIVLVPTGKECVGKKNGKYAMSPCQAEYMSCFMESGYKMKCSEGFVFSRRFLECVGKEFCEE